jgi:hypothetical protein
MRLFQQAAVDPKKHQREMCSLVSEQGNETRNIHDDNTSSRRVVIKGQADPTWTNNTFSALDMTFFSEADIASRLGKPNPAPRPTGGQAPRNTQNNQQNRKQGPKPAQTEKKKSQTKTAEELDAEMDTYMGDVCRSAHNCLYRFVND